MVRINKNIDKGDLRTTNRSAVLKRLCDLWIEFDIEILLDRELLVTLLASLLDPRGECGPYQGKNYIAHIRTGHFSDLTYNGQCTSNLLVREPKLQDLV